MKWGRQINPRVLMYSMMCQEPKNVIFTHYIQILRLLDLPLISGKQVVVQGAHRLDRWPNSPWGGPHKEISKKVDLVCYWNLIEILAKRPAPGWFIMQSKPAIVWETTAGPRFPKPGVYLLADCCTDHHQIACGLVKFVNAVALPLLPQLACKILKTTNAPFEGARARRR